MKIRRGREDFRQKAQQMQRAEAQRGQGVQGSGKAPVELEELVPENEVKRGNRGHSA
jgi:hypothetical protein